MACDNVLIVGPARSGSTLLGLGLGSHPDARYAGEVAMWHKKWGRFVNDDRTRRISSKYFGSSGFAPEIINPPLPWRPHPNITPQTAALRAYMKEVLSQRAPPAMVGKIMFDTMPMGHTLWPDILEMNLSFVLVYRSNLLASLVSWRVAFQTKVWNVDATESKPAPESSIELDPLEVLHYFVNVDAHLNYWEQIIKFRQGILVQYEELISDWYGTMSQIFNQLGWRPARVEPGLKKRTEGTLPQLVSNFAELREFFQDTCWAGFFHSDH